MEDTDQEDLGKDMPQGVDQIKTGGKMDVVELSLSSLVGLTTPYSKKIRGRVNNKAIIVLIDCGASYIFISSSLIYEMALTLTPTRGFGVTLGARKQIRFIRVCRQLCLHLPEVDIVSYFFPLPLGSINLIFGYEWLLSLEATHINWKELTMEFSVEGQRVQLHGDPSLCKT